MNWKISGVMRREFRLKENKMNQLLQENSIATLKVLRLGEMGAFLDGGTGNTNDDILLHKKPADPSRCRRGYGNRIPVS